MIMPCPFCDFADVQIDEVYANGYAICCPECEAIGPISRVSIENAIDLWNRPHECDFKMDRLVQEAKAKA